MYNRALFPVRINQNTRGVVPSVPSPPLIYGYVGIYSSLLCISHFMINTRDVQVKPGFLSL